MPHQKTYSIFIEIIRWLLLSVLLSFVYLMWSIVSPYIQAPYPTDIDFLAPKQWALQIKPWRWSFYIHITSSLIVLLAGTGQFSKYVLKKHPKWHRWAGKTYVFLILGLAAPTGLIMAFYANGGLLGQIAFTLQALFWWGFTFVAFAKIRQGNLSAHGKWMFRSFAMSLSAVTLRIFIYTIGYLQLPLDYYQSYVLVAWTSWIFNLLVAELLIGQGAVSYFFNKKAS